ncbi:hypothetical protein HMSSN139_22840 [Paenibacillus sp. HMSSN-139]|nr:hypothetical protein HMSSN139_22840 [Paenibacillus sp. HMSSN-139]
MTKTMKSRGLKKNLPLLLLAAPGLLYFLLNSYIPMAGVFIAFKNIDYAKGIFRSDWIGFDNFRFLFQTSDAWIMTRNTLLYNVAFIVFGTIFRLSSLYLCRSCSAKHTPSCSNRGLCCQT